MRAPTLFLSAPLLICESGAQKARKATNNQLITSLCDLCALLFKPNTRMLTDEDFITLIPRIAAHLGVDEDLAGDILVKIGDTPALNEAGEIEVEVRGQTFRLSQAIFDK
jgi:hypothetical protein